MLRRSSIRLMGSSVVLRSREPSASAEASAGAEALAKASRRRDERSAKNALEAILLATSVQESSEAHLRQSLTYNADSVLSRYFLAETLFELDRDADAIAELRKVIAAPVSRDFEPEDRVYKQRAVELLAQRQPGR
jgi:hypothetical protein